MTLKLVLEDPWVQDLYSKTTTLLIKASTLHWSVCSSKQTPH